jgi:hypothetical protein
MKIGDVAQSRTASRTAGDATIVVRGKEPSRDDRSERDRLAFGWLPGFMTIDGEGTGLSAEPLASHRRRVESPGAPTLFANIEDAGR